MISGYSSGRLLAVKSRFGCNFTRRFLVARFKLLCILFSAFNGKFFKSFLFFALVLGVLGLGFSF